MTKWDQMGFRIIHFARFVQVEVLIQVLRIFGWQMWASNSMHSTKKPVTTMLTYPWKCTVLHCNHLGNTWKPLVLMTRHFDYCPSTSEGDNQNVRSSAPVVSRCFPGGYNVKQHISRGRLAWWLLAFLHSDEQSNITEGNIMLDTVQGESSVEGYIILAHSVRVPGNRLYENCIMIVNTRVLISSSKFLANYI